MNPLKKCVTPVILLLMMAACTPSTGYRQSLGDCIQQLNLVDGKYQRAVLSSDQHCEGGSTLGTTSFYSIKSEANSASVAIVEFDDQGYTQNPQLYEKTLSELKQIHQKTGALVIVFAHGWKHHAKFDDSNLIEFEKMLLDINEADRTDCEKRNCVKQRETVGVFLSWRGLSMTTPYLNETSFWNRKKKAQRVGQDGAIRLLADLDTMNTRECPDSACTNNRLVIIGHSFGGALIYSATRQRITADLSSASQHQKENRGDGGPPSCEKVVVNRSVADLIVLINPAFEAARYWGIDNAAKNLCFNDTQKPVLVIYTSESDHATKNLFKAGRWLSTLFVNYNDDHENQKQENRTAIGHYKPYITHHLVSTSDIDEASNTINYAELVCSWEKFRLGKTPEWRSDSTKLVRTERAKSKGQITNPYMVVKVDKAIIKDHTKIWEGEYRDHLFNFLLMQKGDAYRIDCEQWE